MNRSRLDLPHIKLLIAQRVAGGYSQREIAKELNTSQPIICRMVKRKDVSDLINKITDELLQQVSEVFKIIKNDPKFMADLQAGLVKHMLNIGKRL
jgi:DNA-binding MarR family transcriptional regulator